MTQIDPLYLPWQALRDSALWTDCLLPWLDYAEAAIRDSICSAQTTDELRQLQGQLQAIAQLRDAPDTYIARLTRQEQVKTDALKEAIDGERRRSGDKYSRLRQRNLSAGGGAGSRVSGGGAGHPKRA